MVIQLSSVKGYAILAFANMVTPVFMPESVSKLGFPTIDPRPSALNYRQMHLPQGRLAALANRLKEERQKRDLSRSAFCRLVGLNRGTLRSLERGTQQPSQDTLDKLARFLHLTPAAIAGLEEKEYPDPLLGELIPEDLALAKAYHHAGADLKYAIKELFGLETSLVLREQLGVLLIYLLRHPGLLATIQAIVVRKGRGPDSVENRIARIVNALLADPTADLVTVIEATLRNYTPSQISTPTTPIRPPTADDSARHPSSHRAQKGTR